MKVYVRTTMMRIKKPNMTLNHQQKNILKSNVLSHKNFQLSHMFMLNKKTLLSMLSISMLVILTACQPKHEVDKENNSSSDGRDLIQDANDIIWGTNHGGNNPIYNEGGQN